MERYQITGGKKLEGECHIKGAKNAVLPILAAAILSGKESVIRNCPNLSDVKIMANILEELGCEIIINDNTIVVNSRHIGCSDISDELAGRLRSSVFLMGPMIARCGKVNISYPGGCEIGLRPIDIHLKVLRQLGVRIEENHGYLQCDGSKLHGSVIQLDFPSVGATENGMMAAVLAEGETRLQNVAKEPEIVDLQNFLNSMGAKVSGAGSEEVVIEGTKMLGNTEYSVMPDRITAGTFLTAAAITGGEIDVKNMDTSHLSIVISKLIEAGCKISEGNGVVRIKGPDHLKNIDMIKTLPYPGFPTDMQSQFLAALCTAKGTSLICETIFENRYKPVDDLTKMGAKIVVEGRIAIVSGVERLMGAKVCARDLRGGAALILAGLAAEGETTIESIHHIDRGYEKIEDCLRAMGAKIDRIKDDDKKKGKESGSRQANSQEGGR